MKAHDAAVDEYALKHTYEKAGDHWERKEADRSRPQGNLRPAVREAAAAGRQERKDELLGAVRRATGEDPRGPRLTPRRVQAPVSRVARSVRSAAVYVAGVMYRG